MDLLFIHIDKASYIYRYMIAGGIMMFILAPLSVYTLGFIIQSFIRLRRSRIAPASLVRDGQAVSTADEYEQYRNAVTEDSSSLAQVIVRYLHLAERGEPFLPEENVAPIDAESDYLYHTISPLGIIYTCGPLIGLLGTILGLIHNFAAYAANVSQDSSVVSVGINEPLVATMWGLIVAIPAYAMAHVLKTKIFYYERKLFPHSVEQVMAVCAPFAQSFARKKAAPLTANIPKQAVRTT